MGLFTKSNHNNKEAIRTNSQVHMKKKLLVTSHQIHLVIEQFIKLNISIYQHYYSIDREKK